MVLLVNHSVPVEGIQHSEPSVTLNIENSDVGAGTLYITESCVLWLNSNDQGIQLEYKMICLHAISRDLQAFHREHLLCHYEGKLPGLNSQEEHDDEDEEEDAESELGVTEIRFVPENKESLEAMFEALANCQTLHPDSDCQLSDGDFEDADEEGGGDILFDSEDGVSQLTEQGRANLERFNHILESGQGDADITARTNQMNITNGFHNNGPPTDADQFQDAEDMDQ